jgi:hypothetical protein
VGSHEPPWESKFYTQLGTQRNVPSFDSRGRGLASSDARMATVEEYRRTAWDCLKLAEGASNPETRASMLELAQVWLDLADKAERYDQYRLAGYRAKAYECQSRARRVSDPERRADLETFAQLWVSLTEPVPELRGAYEAPPLPLGNIELPPFSRDSVAGIP